MIWLTHTAETKRALTGDVGIKNWEIRDGERRDFDLGRVKKSRARLKSDEGGGSQCW